VDNVIDKFGKKVEFSNVTVRGMVILPSLGKDFFTSDSKEFFA